MKSRARSFLHATCTCGTILYPTCTCRTYSYSSVTLAIHHKSHRSVLSPSDVHLWDSSPSDQWDPTAYVSRVPIEPFSISIRPMGPDGLRVTYTCGTIRPLGPNGLRVTCTCGTFLHLHLTCGTRRLVCHLLPPGFNKFKLKNHETW
jgi:hypothetical protein